MIAIITFFYYRIDPINEAPNCDYVGKNKQFIKYFSRKIRIIIRTAVLKFYFLVGKREFENESVRVETFDGFFFSSFFFSY